MQRRRRLSHVDSGLMKLAGAVTLAMLAHLPAMGQQPPSGWQTGIDLPATPKPSKSQDPAAPAEGLGQLRLEALLTSDGQHIDQGLVWHVFQQRGTPDGKLKLVETRREPTPLLKLPPGDYRIVASFGRANRPREITVKAGAAATERFVLDAGGLRLTAYVGNAEAPAKSVTYQILSDERDQLGNRSRIMAGARPGLIIRLNAGIYQIVSTYGDANAVVRSDVTVEAGKLTEAAVTHAAARVTFKLVNRAGGEAIADTQWSVLTAQGEVVKESVGALPTHILAPGSYIAVARSAGNSYRREFQVRNGDTAQVEVLVR